MRWLGYLVYLLLMVVLLGELAFGLLSLDRKYPPYDTAEIDRTLGWKPKANYVYDGIMKDFNGLDYTVKFSTNEDGFRRFPSATDRNKPQVLVIGDSFTQAVEVSDDEAYYRYFEDSLNAQVYAYGMAGYGTLQELMILEQYLDHIKPDLVVLQFCSNDFIDNDLLLEQKANYQVGLRRPYLTGADSPEYRHPQGKLAGWLQHTNFLHFCWKTVGKIRRAKGASGVGEASEEKITRGKAADQDYARSIQTTKKLLENMKEVIGEETPLVAFSSDVFQPQYTDFYEICRALDIPHLPFPNGPLGRARKEEEVFTHDGFHWNPLGHQVVGSALAKELRSYLP
ncbi:MAG: SGNH/GDSL hydrolase family protein [Bacteroidota bacterium]